MRIKLGVFFGGKSVEHEISVITMIQALEGIDEEKYEIVPIYIAKNGVMYTGDDLLDLEQYKDLDVLLKRSYKVTLVNDGKKPCSICQNQYYLKDNHKLYPIITKNCLTHIMHHKNILLQLYLMQIFFLSYP